MSGEIQESKRNGRREQIVSSALLAAVLAVAPCSRAAHSATKRHDDIRRDAAVEAIQRVMPAVVNIRTETIIERNDPYEQLLREFWGPFYRRRGPETTYSLGSGFMIDEEGWVLTNFHVVNRATKVFVRTADGREFEAERVVGTSLTDVALLRIISTKPEKFPVIQLAADDDLLLGETVIALGNPFGLGGSVSKGILSSKSRRPPTETGPLEIEDWLQTDAAINPGNSGGPLVNLRGELIGMSVAVYRDGQGIGFAVPVKRVAAAVAEMYSPEVLKSLWFGARVRPGQTPLPVLSVQQESPAAKAGLLAGDKIAALNGRALRGFIDFSRELVRLGTNGATANLTVERGRERRVLSLRLPREETFFNTELIRKKIGATVDSLTPELARTLGLGDRRGVIVTGVDRDGPAARAGLRRDMIVTMVDGRVTSYEGQASPPFVPMAKMLHAKARGEKSQFDVLVPRRVGRFIEIHQAKVELTVR